jgi:hypothetical protein
MFIFSMDDAEEFAKSLVNKRQYYVETADGRILPYEPSPTILRDVPYDVIDPPAIYRIPISFTSKLEK